VPEDAQVSPRGHIVQDDGPASSGGASSTQRVKVRRPDGTEYAAHAKFAKDTLGAIIAERGEEGLAAEFVASRLAGLLGAPVPETDVVMIAAEVDVCLRNDRRPDKALPAIASHTIDPWTDVNAPDTVEDAPLDDLAAISALHSWVEAGDRGHNMIRAAGRAYAIDHPTALGSTWSGTNPPGTLVVDGLTQARLAANPKAMVAAAAKLRQVPNDAIDGVVDAIPAEWVPSADVRSRLKANLKASRDAVARAIGEAYGSA
jgi:HipA-like protein